MADIDTYADSSFLVSLYIQDAHAAEVERFMAGDRKLWLTPLHRAEWTHAIFQHVFYRKLSLLDAQELHRQFEEDRRKGPWIEIALLDQTFDLCADIARRQVPSIGARTLDSLHVASALKLKAQNFLTFDKRQAKLAEAEGLRLL